MAEPLCGAAARSSSTQSTTIAETPALTHIPHLDSQKPQTNQSRRSHKEPGRLRRPQPRVRNLNTKAEASTRPPTLHKQQQTRNNTKRRASGTKHRRPEAVKSGVSQLVFNFRVSSLFLIWVLISTSNLCICTHHNGHPTKLYLTLSPPRYHLSNATLTIYTIRDYYSHKSYIALRDPIQNHTLHNPIHYSLAPLNLSLLKSSTTKCHLSIISLAHTQCSPRTHYPLHPTFYKALLPPTALSPHALPHPAHPTPHHPKHTTVSQKNCTYHTKITTPQKNFKQKSILPTSLPSAWCRRRGQPPYALPPPHLQSPHNHRPHPHPPCGPRNPNLTNLGFPDPHQPLSDPEKHRFRIRHPQPRHSGYPHPRPQHSHTRFRHDFTSDKIRLRLRSLPLPPKDHPTNPQARPLRPPQSLHPNPNLAPNNNGANTPPKKLPHT